MNNTDDSLEVIRIMALVIYAKQTRKNAKYVLDFDGFSGNAYKRHPGFKKYVTVHPSPN